MPSASPLLIALLLMVSAVSPAIANGGISLNQTRVVFPATQKAHTVTVKNAGPQTYLIQSRIQHSLGNQGATPFVVTPPLFHLGPERNQLLRILKQDEALPADRESLFYLSVLAIPASSPAALAKARLSMGLQFVIKLFYRPDGLKLTPQEAYCQLRFTRTAQGTRVENPTPYFLTFGSLKFDNQIIDLDRQPSMIAPMSTLNYPGNKPVKQTYWQTITDFGGLSALCQQTVSPQQGSAQ